MSARRSTKVKIMVTSPELEDTVLVAAEGDNSRLSTKESFGKISLSPTPDEGQLTPKKTPLATGKPSKKTIENIDEESGIVRFAKNRPEKATIISGEAGSNSDASEAEEPMMIWKRDDNISEMMAVQKQLGLKPAGRIRPLFALSSEEDNSESEISIDGDEIIPAEMLQTWETGSTFSQTEDDDDV